MIYRISTYAILLLFTIHIMILSTAPKLNKLYTEVLKYINSVISGLPLLQEIDRHNSKGVNGQFTLILLIIIIVINVLVTDTYYLSLLIGFYYPAFRTIRTIKSTSIVEYHRWATYWLIFISTGIIFRGIVELVIGYLPYYELWKMGFYVALYHPKFDYAYKFYLLVLKPFLKRIRLQQKESFKNISQKVQPREPKYSLNLESNDLQIGAPRKYSDASAKST